MIKLKAPKVMSATFSILLPLPVEPGPQNYILYPTGTGFFVSDAGVFLTAAHVITTDGQPNGPLRQDLHLAKLDKEAPL